jgi:putative spermidine/putrescine transport system permease protein
MRQNPVIAGLSRLLALLVAAFLVLPAFIVVPLSLSNSMFLQFPPPGFSTQWFSEFFRSPDWTAALWRSLAVASSSAIVAVTLGLLATYGVLRGRGRLARLTEPVMMVPMMVPVVIFGFGLYLLVLDLGIAPGLWMVVLAHAALALPFVLVTLGAALRTVDHRLELAARVHGASPPKAFVTVIVPLIAPAIGAALLLAVMLSLDEAVVALFLVGDTTPTLSVQMFSSITYDLNPLVPVAATVLIAISLVLGVSAAVLIRLGRRRANAW